MIYLTEASLQPRDCLSFPDGGCPGLIPMKVKLQVPMRASLHLGGGACLHSARCQLEPSWCWGRTSNPSSRRRLVVRFHLEGDSKRAQACMAVISMIFKQADGKYEVCSIDAGENTLNIVTNAALLSSQVHDTTCCYMSWTAVPTDLTARSPHRTEEPVLCMDCGLNKE